MNTLQAHGKMKQVVHDVLANDERSRNDDRWLQLKVLEAMGYNIVIGKEAIVWYIDPTNFDIPNFESIRRVRQELQNNEGQFLPTDPAVLYQRRIKEETIRSYYSHDHSKISAWQTLAYQVE